MRYKFTTEEYKKIEELVECAIIAPNKAAAKKYSGQLNYIGSDVTGCSRNVYSELTAAVVSASGAIHDKDLLTNSF